MFPAGGLHRVKQRQVETRIFDPSAHNSCICHLGNSGTQNIESDVRFIAQDPYFSSPTIATGYSRTLAGCRLMGWKDRRLLGEIFVRPRKYNCTPKASRLLHLCNMPCLAWVLGNAGIWRICKTSWRWHGVTWILSRIWSRRSSV